ncbi:MAG: hypothetical protein Q7R73_00125 [bacterium]|nr:hypothetical protein [bacterium]
MKTQTLVRIRALDGFNVELRIPGWQPKISVFLKIQQFPLDLRIRVCPGAYFLAKMNLGAEKADGLEISDLELAPNPVPEDEL